MKSSHITLATALALAASSSLACGWLGGSDDSKHDSVTPASGGTGAAGAGGAPAGGAAAGGSGGGIAPPPSCAGLPGPAMVGLKAPDGTSYCIDRTEVTQEQYAEFLAKVTAKPGSEHPSCSDNTEYKPETNKPGTSWEPNDCLEDNWTPELTPNRPVSCISWCDAFAYCAWAGKRLCGKVGGGSGATADAANAKLSQWYNACSQGGTTKYPYGDTFDAGTCESGYTSTTKKDVAARVGCKGTAEPYASIRDLSGSVAEFTDECATYPIDGLVCTLRGGGWVDSDTAAFACDSIGTVNLGLRGKAMGFRCCKD